MEEQLISFETAFLAKEKGFKESCIHWFHSDTKEHGVYDTAYRYQERIKGKEIFVPKQSLLQKWLREVHNMEVFVIPRMNDHTLQSKKYTWMTYYKENLTKYNLLWDTFEEALEVGLLYTLKLIKNDTRRNY